MEPAPDPHQTNLMELMKASDVSVLDTEEWKEIWESFQKTGAQDVAQFRADEDLGMPNSNFDRIDNKGRTSPAHKRLLVQRAILSGTFIGRDEPEVAWAEVKDHCLEPDDLGQWGLQR